jgi:hypothetical protein
MFIGSSLVFWLVVLGEAGAGLGVMIGGLRFANAAWVTRGSGAVVAIIMAGAARFHFAGFGGAGTHPWHFAMMGAEFQVLLMLLGVAFFVRGNAEQAAPGAIQPAAWSVGRQLEGWRRRCAVGVFSFWA